MFGFKGTGGGSEHGAGYGREYGRITGRGYGDGTNGHGNFGNGTGGSYAEDYHAIKGIRIDGLCPMTLIAADTLYRS